MNSQLNTVLRKPDIRVIVFAGTEDYAKKVGQTQLYETLQKRYNGDPDRVVFSGGSLNWDSLWEYGATPSFFTVHKLIILREPEKIRNKTELKRFLQDVPEFVTCLIDSDNAKPKGELKKTLPANAAVITFSPPKEDQLGDWICRQVTGYGHKISAAAAEVLLERVGPIRAELVSEINKLCTMTPSASDITEEHVRGSVAYNRQVSIFNFLNVLAAKDFSRSLAAFRRLYRMNEPLLRINYMVIRSLRQWWQVLERLEKGVTWETIKKQVRLNYYEVKNMRTFASRYRLSSVKRLYRQMRRLDYELKFLDAELQPIAFERFVYRFCFS